MMKVCSCDLGVCAGRGSKATCRLILNREQGLVCVKCGCTPTNPKPKKGLNCENILNEYHVWEIQVKEEKAMKVGDEVYWRIEESLKYKVKILWMPSEKDVKMGMLFALVRERDFEPKLIEISSLHEMPGPCPARISIGSRRFSCIHETDHIGSLQHKTTMVFDGRLCTIFWDDK